MIFLFSFPSPCVHTFPAMPAFCFHDRVRAILEVLLAQTTPHDLKLLNAHAGQGGSGSHIYKLLAQKSGPIEKTFSAESNSKIWIITQEGDQDLCLLFAQRQDGRVIPGHHAHHDDTDAEIAHRICQHLLKPLIAPRRIPTAVLSTPPFRHSIWRLSEQLMSMIWPFCDLKTILTLEETATWLTKAIRRNEILWEHILLKLRT
eukprot:Blabericola_migrator_1__1743@NODE_146_length_12961_cov_103_787110_g127_i0_p6_GENE_NODE_146_length_12961_cov_103_787110_g127_i0NODE_146_length_12961_cov_103_787110_g127_i0_p6_ORF_typecomplete_len203_score16_57Phage_P2_GpE/PF06528_12/0_071DUF4904/PF16247_5/0_23_NODE_146_length_12961_cov_103_787110_g127_i06391247